MCPLFLPWFCGVDIYPTPTWIRTRPVPSGWTPHAETKVHIAKAELYVRSHPLLRKHLGERYKMPREQQWFWEVEYEQAEEKGMEATFRQEMPADDVECFAASFDSVFGRDVIELVESHRKKEWEAYGLCGQSIEDRHEPPSEDILREKERIVVPWRSPRGETYRWELIPLNIPPSDDPLEEIDPNGKLFIYEHPRSGVDYSIGIDTSNGIGHDATVIAVCARGASPSLPDVQVAEFRSAYVNHVEAFAFAMAIAAYYSKYMGESTVHSQPYVSIEQIMAVGDTCQLQMKKLGYHRFHRMVRYDSTKIKKAKAMKEGWFSHTWSRPILCDGFVVAVQNAWYTVNSPWTIEEMRHWEVHYTATGKEKKEHAEDSTDDGIFANAMATFCPNDLAIMAHRSKNRFMGQLPGELPAVDLRPYDGTTVSTRQKPMESLNELLYS